MDRIKTSGECLKSLNWDVIKRTLQGNARTDIGREALHKIEFSMDPQHVRDQLAAVTEFQKLHALGVAPHLASCSEFGTQLKRVAEGRMLSGEEFVALGNTLRSTAHLRSNLMGNDSKEFPFVASLASRMVDTMPTARWILNTFEPSGRVRDDATPRLSELRRNHVRLLQRTKRTMEDYIHSYELQEMLQDNYYTVREERFVLPVKAQHRPRVAGIIHGSSGTGATVFIEPEALVEANNQLLLLHEDMEREIERILFERTERILGELDSLTGVLDVISEADQVSAKAIYSAEYQCTAPSVAIQGVTHLKAARNPVLELKGTEVVPNDILIDATTQFLIITGPNTGGKTVTLMSLGLMTLMTSAGIPIPAESGSQVGLFPRMYTLFGDPQDIGTDRSTFSGQLARVSAVMDTAGPGSLVLMDEPIVGTEPAGGAALAISVLEFLADRKARGAVTTHYDRLKTLSLEDERFENASVGVHPGTLKPNFQLTMGVAGSSSPISIAEQLGLKGAVVARARELAGESPEVLQNALTKLDSQRESMAKAELELRAERKELEVLRQRLIDRGKEEARKTQADVLSKLEDAAKQVKAAIRSVQEGADPRKLQRIQKRLQKLETQVEGAVTTPSPTKKSKVSEAGGLKNYTPEEFHLLKEGMEVYLAAHGRLAVIAQTPDSPSRIAVKMGSLGMKVNLTDLAHPPKAKKTDSSSSSQKPAKRVKSAASDPLPPKTVDVEVDLRGARVDEALDTLTKRLDRATLENRDALYVIHGHGSGALRGALRKHLTRSRYVENWESGGPEHGGDGVTIVFLR